MATKNVTAAAANVETITNVENAAEIAPQTNAEKLAQLNADLIDARRAVRESTDETYDAAAAHAADVKRQIAAIEKQIDAENAAIEFNGKRTARKSILDVMIDAAIDAAKQPENADYAANFAAKYNDVLTEWMAKFSTPPQTATTNGTPRKQRAANGDNDGKQSTTKPELTAMYNDAVSAGKSFAEISADFYNRFPRSTVWHGLNDIKTGAIAVPQLANGHV